MSRRAVDPVDRAFDHWRGLTTEEQQQLAERQYGWRAAKGDIVLSQHPPKRKRKAPAAEQPQ